MFRGVAVTRQLGAVVVTKQAQYFEEEKDCMALLPLVLCYMVYKTHEALLWEGRDQ